MRLTGLSVALVLRVALVVAAAALLGATVLAPEPSGTGSENGGAALRLPPLSAPARPKLAPPDQWSAIVQRPLFHPTRLPWTLPVAPPAAPVATVAPAPPAPPAQWVLVGTALGPSERVAVLRTPAAAEARLVREGDLLDGWVVTTIAHDRLRLAHGDAAWTITLQGSK
jgi:hypothetical protein